MSKDSKLKVARWAIFKYMSLRQYISIMLFSTILCWTSFGFVVINIDPFEAGFLSFSFFYVSVFFALVGTLSIIFFGFYSMFSRKDEPLFKSVQGSFRDGILVSIVLTIMLYMQGMQMLNMWNAVALIAALVSLLIFLFFSKKASRV